MIEKIILIICLLLSIISLINIVDVLNHNNVIYLEKCQRLAVDCVYGEEQPYYLVFKDCEQEPQIHRVKKFTFVEK